MPNLYWTPISLTYLTQLLLVAVILTMLWYVQRSHFGPPPTAVSGAARILRIAFLCYGTFTFLRFLSSALAPAQKPWIDPLVAVFSSAALAAFTQFVYRFPEPVPRQRLERQVVASLTGAFVLVEIGFAAWRYWLLLNGVIEFRPQYLDLPVILMALWLVFLALAKVLRLRRTRAVGVAGAAGYRAALALLYFCVPALLLVLVILLGAYGILAVGVTDILASVLNIVGLLAFALLFLNYLTTRGSFTIKLSATALALVLGVFGGVAWLVGPGPGGLQHAATALSGKAVRFVPGASGGYRLETMPFRFQSIDENDRFSGSEAPVTLPFAFPFFSSQQTQLFVRDDGMLGFEALPLWRSAAADGGAFPAIYPLAVELSVPEPPQPGRGVFIAASPAAVTITFSRLQASNRPADLYSFQVTLLPTGEIDFAYRELPATLTHSLSDANVVPLVAGITPGTLYGAVSAVALLADRPVALPPDTGAIEDYHLAFLADLDRFYRPLAWYVLAATVATLLSFAALFRLNLVRPLDALLRGVEQFREGRLASPLPVRYPDEIGVITQSFNDMVRARLEMLDGLETYVAERTAEVASLADRNARLQERDRISGDLHDAVSQTLFSSVLIADTLPKYWQTDPGRAEAMVADVARLNRSALAEMRKLLTRVRAVEVLDPPFGAVLRKLATDFQAGSDAVVSVTIGSDGALAEEVQIVFFRIAQEALNNVAKHAQASEVWLFFETLGGQAMLTIADDGIGFDPETLRPGSMGLGIMADRARRIGATLEIAAKPGGGASLTLIWNRNDDR